MDSFDIIVIGSGPGGYVTAIRASQLGFKTAIVEKENLGGICLNWGCIPTKSLLKSAQVFDSISSAQEYGISLKGEIQADLDKMVSRSRGVADGMSKGIQFLMKKNSITVLKGHGKIKESGVITVENSDGKSTDYNGKHIIIATGARSRVIPPIPQDGKCILGYRDALTLSEKPKSIAVIGSGAIGLEFAYFYNSIGVEVTLIEALDRIAPLEDAEISKELERNFRKQKITVKTGVSVEKVETDGTKCTISLKEKGEVKTLEIEKVLSAIGIQANIENLGLEELGIKTEKGRIIVDDFYATNVSGVYAIGDVINTPALAHVASAEGITCVEKIANMNVTPIDYANIPGCTYCTPEVASVGYTEEQAEEKGYALKVGKFPFSASGKASASGHKEGFVKLIFEEKYGELLGAHMIGYNVTEMIAEIVAIKKLETTGHELIKTIHPHPTMSEAIMEAAAAAYDEVIHL